MQFKTNSVVVLAVISCLHANGAPVSDTKEEPDADLNELKAYMHDQSTSRQSTGVSALSSVISSLLGQFGTAISPSLGPLAPLAGAVGPSINNGLTGILSNAVGGLFGLVSRGDLPISGYETYLVNIPNQGSYILLAKSPALQEPTTPSPIEIPSIPKPSSPQTQFIAELNRLGLNALIAANPALQQKQLIADVAAAMSSGGSSPPLNPIEKPSNNALIPLNFLKSFSTPNSLNSLTGQQTRTILDSFRYDDANMV